MTERESGFTLVELLLAVSILAIITVPLTAAMISVLSSMGITNARLAESHDAQLLAQYWSSDVHSAQQVLPLDLPCDADGPVVSLVRGRAGEPNPVEVQYSLATQGTDRVLVRSVPASGTSVVVAHDVQRGSCAASPSLDTAALAAPVLSVAGGARWRLSLLLQAPGNPGNYTFHVDGRQRTS